MPAMRADRSMLLLIDLQTRLMPAIAESETMVANARRLLQAAALLEVPVTVTEQNPARLGDTVPPLGDIGRPALAKMSFSATGAAGFEAARAGRDTVIVAGCEAHVCVLQSALALVEQGLAVHVVADAVGSRAPGDKAAALARLARHGVDVVSTEMVVFEWLGTAAHPRFREVVALIK